MQNDRGWCVPPKQDSQETLPRSERYDWMLDNKAPILVTGRSHLFGCLSEPIMPKELVCCDAQVRIFLESLHQKVFQCGRSLFRNRRMIILKNLEHSRILCKFGVRRFTSEQLNGCAADAPDVRCRSKAIFLDHFRCHLGRTSTFGQLYSSATTHSSKASRPQKRQPRQKGAWQVQSLRVLRRHLS